MVSGLPHSGQIPPRARLASGSSRTPHLRWPSRWYFPSSGKNSSVPDRPSPVRKASRHGEVIEFAAERRRLAAEHGRRMRVRVAHQLIAVQRRAHPVHGGIRREPGLDREYLAGQVPVAVGDEIEPGFRAKDGEPRCPCVGRDEVAAGSARQGDLQEVPRGQAENRPAIRGKVADLAQRFGDPVRGLESRRVDQVVNFPGPVAATVDRGYLGREQETNLPGTTARRSAAQLTLKFGTEPEQSGFGRNERFTQFRPPRRDA